MLSTMKDISAKCHVLLRRSLTWLSSVVIDLSHLV